MVPVFILTFYLPYPWSVYSAAVVFILASLTDWLDGYLARRLNQATDFGAFLDPVADKLMVCVALTLIATQAHSIIITLSVLLIVVREIVISSLREWVAKLGQSSLVAVSKTGKYKTASQMIAITCLLLGSISPYMMYVGLISLHLAAFLSVTSMYFYLKNTWPLLLNSSRCSVSIHKNPLITD
jgi:CDP-diacylglycerol--glycerol-3-phosphate 3-phosphatidyltransferase